jgi:deoxyribonuclease V
VGACGVAVEFSIRKARLSQVCLAKEVIEVDLLPKQIGLVGGVEAAYVGNWAFGVAVVLDYGSLEFCEGQTVTQRVEFPYVPTLLSFRELPYCCGLHSKVEAAA